MRDAKVEAIVAGGVVVEFKVLDGGADYWSVPELELTGGGCSLLPDAFVEVDLSTGQITAVRIYPACLSAGPGGTRSSASASDSAAPVVVTGFRRLGLDFGAGVGLEVGVGGAPAIPTSAPTPRPTSASTKAGAAIAPTSRPTSAPTPRPTSASTRGGATFAPTFDDLFVDGIGSRDESYRYCSDMHGIFSRAECDRYIVQCDARVGAIADYAKKGREDQMFEMDYLACLERSLGTTTRMGMMDMKMDMGMGGTDIASAPPPPAKSPAVCAWEIKPPQVGGPCAPTH